MKSSFAEKGTLWVLVGGTLWRSTDGGANFSAITTASPRLSISNFTLGKAAPNHDHPTIFIFSDGTSLGGEAGFFRSDDNGTTWEHINDDQQQFGGNPTVMTGDPRVYGRLFIGMNGRGILYGDPQ